MNEAISLWDSEAFYKDKLVADKAIIDAELAEILKDNSKDPEIMVKYKEELTILYEEFYKKQETKISEMKKRLPKFLFEKIVEKEKFWLKSILDSDIAILKAKYKLYK